ncbi:MAG TPA: hypothetical protein PK026_08405 [Bacteroides graminisolvens]|nr:hypothetical protein [Bacteroides graminisolvens]
MNNAILKIASTIFFIIVWILIYSSDLEIKEISVGIDIYPLIIILDFSMRSFFKKKPTLGILPYLCLPIKRKTLLLYIIFSALQSISIWAPLFFYTLVIYIYQNFNIINYVVFLNFILLNNYTATLVNTLANEYMLLLFPFALVFIATVLLFVGLVNPVLKIIIIFSAILLIIVLLYFVLKENIYRELDNNSL